MKSYIVIMGILVLIVMCGCTVKEAAQAPAQEETPAVQEQPAQIPAEMPEEIPKEVVEEPTLLPVKLTTGKQMIPNEIKIKAGTTVIWTNEDDYPHNLMIYDVSIQKLEEKDIIRSQNFYQNQSFNHTFTEKGEYVVRDVYSGSMHGEVTASIVMNIGEDIAVDIGGELGKVIVE